MRLSSFVSRKVVLLSAIVAFALAATPASATFPGTNGRIAFMSDATGSLDIYTMNPDGSEVVNVTDAAGAPAFDFEPDWSPDGTKIVFRGGRGNEGEIYTMNADGTGLTQLTSNSFKDYSPTWSPDGSTIAFASNRNDANFATCIGLFGCNIDIFLMPATGGSPVQVTFGSGSDQFPDFSPDGESIVYDTDVGGVYAIYTVDLDSLAVTKLTADSLRAGLPDWSPDGTKITFTSNWYPCKKPKVCKGDIHVMNADGGGVTQLTETFGDNLWPAWSPEGDKIVFGHNNLHAKPSQIYVMDPDGTDLTRITHTNDDSFYPDWGSG
jgi:Tol biopolymer transport system component